MCGALLTSSLAWDISDTFNGLMMVPNLIGVLALSGLVVKITRNYIDRNLKHMDISRCFLLSLMFRKRKKKDYKKFKATFDKKVAFFVWWWYNRYIQNLRITV